MKPKFEKKPGAGRTDGPFTFTVEVGPITLHNYTRAEAKKHVRELRDELDRFARTLMDVGPKSKVVRTKVEEGGE